MNVQRECARSVCKVSVQGEKSFVWGWGAAALFPVGGGTSSIGIGDLGVGWGCECVRQACKVSVQGERAR